jgi:hypothetical protein
MSKLNLDEVLFICLGRAERVEFLVDTERLRDFVLLTEDMESRKRDFRVEGARELTEEDARGVTESSFGGTGGKGCSAKGLPNEE